MTTMEGMPPGAMGNIGQLGDEWAFTLYDHGDRKLLAFVFHTEVDARAAAKAMQNALARAVALSTAEQPAANTPHC